MADIEPAAPTLTHLLDVRAVQDGKVPTYFGDDSRSGYRLDFAAKIVPGLIIALTARLQEAKSSDIRDDENYATTFRPSAMRLGVAEHGPAIVYELDGFNLAMYTPDHLMRELYEQLGLYLSKS